MKRIHKMCATRLESKCNLVLGGLCSTHHELMKDILQITKRPTKQLLGKALKKMFPSQVLRSQWVCQCSDHPFQGPFPILCRKARNMSTGLRPRVVQKLCLFIKKSILNTDAKALLATQLKGRAREQLSSKHRKKSRTSSGSLF